LLVLELQGETPPEVYVVGVVPGSVEYGVGLTDAVRDAVPGAIKKIVEELDRLGFSASPRNPPLEPDIWWEREP
jgi:hydrogenase maturation protease